ncbi:hypothetical protein CRE_04683 [Caenorhabditis remanei]|uniref:Uncharacterized protein n=1 Tax=Caenorhabditis remanei TaxID=31234 RepID=E3LYP4_CAERE|nr:hypothetical protein CRE_04683 [Caenorhabditis remanei]
MACKINFGVQLNSLSFCGPDNIAGLSKSNVKMASSSTGTIFTSIEMDKFSTDIFGCYDEIFIANTKIGIQSLDLETSKLIPVYSLNKKTREELSCSCYNPISENMITAVWCPDTRVTRLSKIDTRSPQGSHDLITVSS